MLVDKMLVKRRNVEEMTDSLKHPVREGKN